MTITFDDIKKANDTLASTNIKDKEYIQVNQRIKAFRMLYPTGFINTHIISLEDGVCTMETVVGYYDEEGKPVTLANGHAQEKEKSSFINRQSFIENCETSACGRALGFCGLGIDTSVASAEEVENAIKNQEEKPKATKEQIDLLLQNASPKWVTDVCEKMKLESIYDMSMEDANGFIKKMNARKDNAKQN